MELTGVVAEDLARVIGEMLNGSQPEPSETTELLVVRGLVYQAEGRLLLGAMERAFDKDLCWTELLLGEATADKNGC